MKIIDLLNKIAKGEDVPKKIKYNKLVETSNNVYTYSKEEKDYIHIDDFSGDDYFFQQIFNSTDMNLNDEVEIIEEKEIEKLDVEYQYSYKSITLKINQLIDEINRLKRKNNDSNV